MPEPRHHARSKALLERKEATRAGAAPRRASPLKALPLSQVYQLLEPGPVVFLTTAQSDRRNVMTMSWHMMVDFTPPLVACVVSSANHSFAALRATGECVLAIPAQHLARKVVAVGNCSGRDVDKFVEIGLTPLPAKLVTAPLVGECFANLECRIADTSLVNRLNIFILEVVRAWIDPKQNVPKTLHHAGYGRFIIDGKRIALESRMP